jgi:hypothetical protein
MTFKDIIGVYKHWEFSVIFHVPHLFNMTNLMSVLNN